MQMGSRAKDKSIPLKNALDVLIINRTAAKISINNGISLRIGESIRFFCNEGEVLTGSLEINFLRNTGYIEISLRTYTN